MLVKNDKSRIMTFEYIIEDLKWSVMTRLHHLFQLLSPSHSFGILIIDHQVCSIDMASSCITTQKHKRQALSRNSGDEGSSATCFLWSIVL
jgi:hypothetical protein